MRPRHILTALLSLPALVTACDPDDPIDGAPDDDGGAGGKADDVDDPASFACQNVTGLGSIDRLAQIHDPIAELLLKRGDSCPKRYGEIVAKLREQDGDGCTPGEDLRTRLVSDDARVAAKPDNYRTVTTRACGSGNESDLVMTLLSVRENEDLAQRGFIEMMAFDPQSQLYDFWVLSGGSWALRGTTLDVLSGKASCASCHNGGGIIMKELDRSWIHWDSSESPLPGADALFTAHGDMFGQRGTGQDLEQVVRKGNAAIIDGRIAHHADPAVGSVKELLRPLFCAVEINLDTAGDRFDGTLSEITADFTLDPHFGVERGVPVPDDVYRAAIADAKQTLPGVQPARQDTELAFLFPERSGIDVAYVQALQDQGIVDADFVTDVLAIDFTQPLLSKDRCALLEQSPQYGDGDGRIAEATPDAIRAGFVATLTAAAPAPGTPAAALLANLEDRDDEASHRAAVDAFLAACQARPADAFMRDALVVAHELREAIRGRSFIEHPEQVPDSALPSNTGARLDPITCAIGPEV